MATGYTHMDSDGTVNARVTNAYAAGVDVTSQYLQEAGMHVVSHPNQTMFDEGIDADLGLEMRDFYQAPRAHNDLVEEVRELGEGHIVPE